jgi:hypothetical protein
VNQTRAPVAAARVTVAHDALTALLGREQVSNDSKKIIVTHILVRIVSLVRILVRKGKNNSYHSTAGEGAGEQLAQLYSSSLYSNTAGMQERDESRVHGCRIQYKKGISASHHPKPMIAAKDFEILVSSQQLAAFGLYCT